MASKLTQEQYIKTLENTVWSPLEPYINARTKILHECNKGHKVFVYPRNAQNAGCGICKGLKDRLTHKEYIKRLKCTKWAALETYKKAKIKILHVCDKGHEQLIAPHHALEDVGCVNCNKPEKLNHFLYYIKFCINGEIFYKIGITKNTIEARFLSDKRYIEKIIFYKEMSYEEAYREEKLILNKFSEYRNKKIVLHNGGNTELFRTDVLGLDT